MTLLHTPTRATALAGILLVIVAGCGGAGAGASAGAGGDTAGAGGGVGGDGGGGGGGVGGNAGSNLAPKVSAGPDQNIALPTTTATFKAVASDADGTIVSYAWTELSGGPATMSGASTAKLSVSALTIGSYVFRVTVADNDGATASADVALYVGPGGNGKTYYFSNTSGDDSRSSTQAQDPATPWKTLAQLTTFFPSLTPGDSVLLKRGDVFDGSITVASSGSANLPIVLSAYGTGDSPKINGLTTLSHWASLGGGIYGSACPTCSAAPNMVVVDGKNTAMGRWPNRDAPGKGYRTITSHVTNTTMTDSQLTDTPNWTGAEVVIRKVHWILDRSPITAHVGDKLTYMSGTSYEASDGFGYFIQNDPKTLDEFGEWYFDPATKTLQMYFGDHDPMDSVIQISTVDTLVSMSLHDDVLFDSLALQGSNLSAFAIASSGNVTIQECDIDFSGRNAIWGGKNLGGSSAGFLLANNTINHTNNNAIVLKNEFVGATIRGNTIQNTGMFEGMGDPAASDAHKAITTYKTDNLLVEQNRIVETGYVGINFYGNSIVIRNNFISDFCKVADDGGGIYTWNGRGAENDFTGDQVLDNIVVNGIGAGDGTLGGNDAAQGIYMDDDTGNVEIAGNTTAYNAYSGIFLHLDHDLNVHDNTSFGNAVSQIVMNSEDPLFLERNVLLNGNVLVALDPGQFAAVFETAMDDIQSFGTFDHNVYARPVADDTTIETIINGFSATTKRTLAGWQAYVAEDAHSTKSPKSVAKLADIRLEYNATSSPKTVSLDTHYVGMDGSAHSGSVQIKPYGSIVLLKK